MSALGIRRLAAILATLLALAAALALSGLLTHGSQVASAGSAFSALGEPVGTTSVAADDPLLQQLAARHPALDLGAARVVLSDRGSTVWVTTSADGELCLLEVADGPTSRFSCRTQDDALSEGVVAGVPGHWYGIVPDGFDAPVVTVNGAAQPVTVSGGAFRLPAAASAITIAGTTFPLPAAP